MDRPRHRTLSVLDFVKWNKAKELILSPKFQRRDMWPLKARSFLIDTILSGFPIPKLYMRQHLDLEKTKTIHEVVDGQQRIRAVLDFYEGKFAISRNHGDYGGSKYHDLDETAREDFLHYEFSVDLLVAAEDSDVLNIFARLNSYSAPLNAQEKRNAKYFGSFKLASYRLAYEHLEFWKSHKIVSDRQIARMREVELTSELLVAMHAGFQDKKKSLDKFYHDWDDEFPGEDTSKTRFRKTIDILENLMGDDLDDTIFVRPALFYSLFMAIYALKFGLGNQGPDRKSLGAGRTRSIRDSLKALSDTVKSGEYPSKLRTFVEATQRQTDNIGPRRIRHATLINTISV